MQIEYQVQRLDVAKGLYDNLLHSKRTQKFFLLVIGIPMGIVLLMHYFFNGGKLMASDFGIALIYGMVLFVLIISLAIFRTKTNRRELTISESGIETQIGTLKGKILWNEVDSIASSKDSIAISGKNSNAFFIPHRAFQSAQQRDEFFRLAQQYHNATTNSKRD